MAQTGAQEQDDLIITRGVTDAAARAVQRRCAAGELARLAPGIYVRDREPQAQAARVREHWVRILGELVPGSVVSYRSAYVAVPSEGVVVLSHPTRFNRTIRLPGLRVALVKGPGPLPGDAPLGGGALHLASMERMLLENLTRTRGQDGRSRGEPAVRERLAQILAGDGAPALERLLANARALAAPLGMGRELERLGELVGALQPAATPPQDAEPAAAPVPQGAADPACIAMLEALAAWLRAQRLPRVRALPAPGPQRRHQAFVEAWFDCFDSADALPLAAARASLLGGKAEAGDGAAMRELLSVFKLAVTSPLCDTVPPFGSGFAPSLVARHALLLRLWDPAEAGRLREAALAGVPKERVVPERIVGTLAAGSTLALAVPEGLARAIFYSILLWRVHPFRRGNEAMARLLMNAELSTVGEGRILIPARLRPALERGRNRLMRVGDPGRVARLLSALQRWTASLDWADLDRLMPRLRRARAFDGPRLAPAIRPRP
jgi:hypothetical protein